MLSTEDNVELMTTFFDAEPMIQSVRNTHMICLNQVFGPKHHTWAAGVGVRICRHVSGRFYFELSL